MIDFNIIVYGGLIFAFLKFLPNYFSNWFYSKIFINLLVTYNEEEYFGLENWVIKQSGFKSFQIKNKELIASRGFYWFFWNKKLVLVWKSKVDMSGIISYDRNIPEEIFVKILFGNQNDLNTLLKDIKVKDDGIKLYLSDSYWRFVGTRSYRDPSTVFLDKDIYIDIEKFINSKDVYQKLGIPYRRGYLFYGPPGTGKTSAILAIATKFKLPIYSINSSVDDQKLQYLFATVPENSIIVFEDIDRLFEKNDKITMSGLLNSIDGIFESDGRILIMTTNNKDSLDSSLIRDGRCDKHYLFDNKEFGNSIRQKLN